MTEPGATVPMLIPSPAAPWASGLSPPSSRSGAPFSLADPGTYRSGGGGSSPTTTSCAGSTSPLITRNVIVTASPRPIEPVAPRRSSSRRPLPSGDVSTCCMSSASGPIARVVIAAPEPSMKNSTAEKRPTPSATPISEATVRRGLRTSSRQT